MPRRRVAAYFECAHCGALNHIGDVGPDFDPTEYRCAYCDGGTWVNLSDLCDRNRQRLVSHRPFEEPESPAEDADVIDRVPDDEP